MATDHGSGRARAAAAPLATGALLIAVATVLSERWWIEVGVVVSLLLAGAAAAVDLRSQRIPDRLVLAASVSIAAALAIDVAVGGGVGTGASVASGVAALALPLLAVHLAVPAGLGFGDVKLGAALGATLGLVDWRYSVGALCVASGVTATVAIVRRRPSLPFAPGLAGGAVLVLLLASSGGSSPWR